MESPQGCRPGDPAHSPIPARFNIRFSYDWREVDPTAIPATPDRRNGVRRPHDAQEPANQSNPGAWPLHVASANQQP
jgi:hypothetical protein